MLPKRPEALPLVDELAAPHRVDKLPESPLAESRRFGDSFAGQKRYFSPTVTTPIGSDEPPKFGYASRLALTSGRLRDVSLVCHGFELGLHDGLHRSTYPGCASRVFKKPGEHVRSRAGGFPPHLDECGFIADG